MDARAVPAQTAHIERNDANEGVMVQGAVQPVLIDVSTYHTTADHSGPQWGYESTDLDLTLLTWRVGERITAHVNTEVDVVLMGVAGTGDVTVNGAVYRLAPGSMLLIPKGLERALCATSTPFRYLSIHQRRRGLWPTVRGELVDGSGASAT